MAAAVPAHASLKELAFWSAALDAPGVMDAVVDAALTRGLTNLRLHFCDVSPVCVPPLVRLLHGDALLSLRIHGLNVQLLDAPSCCCALCRCAARAPHASFAFADQRALLGRPCCRHRSAARAHGPLRPIWP